MRSLLFSRKPAMVHAARGISRDVVVTDDGFMTISVRGWAWRAMDERRREGRTRQVAFPLVAIRSGWFRPARWWRPGVLQLEVPNAGDPWRKRSDRQRKKGVLPKQRPHRIRFLPRHQPAFERCAEQIGLADSEAQP